MKSLQRSKKIVLLSSVGALGIAALLAAVGRREIAEWFDPGPDPRRELVTLDFFWDHKGAGAVRCETRPYLRPDGAWLDVHEFSMDPDADRKTGATDGIPGLGEIEAYLKFRKRDRTPIFGEPGRLAVLVNYDREVPWGVVVNVLGMCKRLGITEVDLDSDD